MQKISGIITIPFHIGDFLTGTLHMDTLEKGAYIMLLCAYYQSGRPLPDDDKILSRIAGVTPKVWVRIKPILMQKFHKAEDRWNHKTCDEVLRKVHEKSSAQRAKALKRHSADDATAMPRQCQPKPKPNIDTKVSINPPTPQGEIHVPDFINCDVWMRWIIHRKEIKKKLTPTQSRGQIKKLTEWYKCGHDPNDIIENSINNGWQGLFEPKESKRKETRNDIIDRQTRELLNEGRNYNEIRQPALEDLSEF